MNDMETSYFATQGTQYINPIANGAFGSVYNVYSSNYQNNFALKKIPIKIFKESEIQCLKAIDDPRIVSLFNYYKFNDSVYLLMEYCPNDLETLFKNRSAMQPVQICQYLYDAIAAVKSCHDRNIAHCDIKPNNFLLDKYGRIKIGDFGLSKIFLDHPSSLDFHGTKLFMAPEIFYKKEFNPMQADIWALGVTIYHLVTGGFPYFASDPKMLLEKIERGVYCDEYIDDRLLANLISRCLVYKPDKRATVDELLKMPYFQQFQFGIDVMEASFMNCHSGVNIIKPKLRPKRSNLANHSLLIFRNLRGSRLQMIEGPSKSQENLI